MIVAVDDQFARDQSVPECHDTSAVLQPHVRDESRRESSMNRANVPKGIPDHVRVRLDQNFSMNGSHDGGPSQCAEPAATRRQTLRFSLPSSSVENCAISRPSTTTRQVAGYGRSSALTTISSSETPLVRSIPISTVPARVLSAGRMSAAVREILSALLGSPEASAKVPPSST